MNLKQPSSFIDKTNVNLNSLLSADNYFEYAPDEYVNS